jgi:hypothetical protein
LRGGAGNWNMMHNAEESMEIRNSSRTKGEGRKKEMKRVCLTGIILGKNQNEQERREIIWSQVVGPNEAVLADV